MKHLSLILVLAAMVLAACTAPDDLVPNLNYDWCREFDFADEASFAFPYGEYYGGIGYVTDENGMLGFSHDAGALVAAEAFEIDVTKAAEGDISVASAGSVFGIDASLNEVIPALAPSGYEFSFPFRSDLPEGAAPLSSTINVTLNTSAPVVIRGLRVFGLGSNPFGLDNCTIPADPTDDGPGTATPPPTNTVQPTPTITPLVSATPTPTVTNTLGPTPTPSPTPTAHYYLSPVLRTGGRYMPYDMYALATYVPQPNAVAVGIVARDRGPASGIGSTWANISSYVTPAAQYPLVGGGQYFEWNTGLPGAMFIDWNARFWFATREPAVVAGIGNGAPQVSTPVGFSFQYWGKEPDYASVWYDYQLVLRGWPSPTPTPTPGASATPSHTPTATTTLTPTPLGSATAGPTFTPTARATNMPLPGATPNGGGGRYNGVNICAYGDGVYLWDARRSSLYSQGWQIPPTMAGVEELSPWVGTGHWLDARANGDREMNLLNQRPRWASQGTITEFMAYATGPGNEWAVAGGNAASEVPTYGTHVTGTGWAVANVTTALQRPLFISVRMFNPISPNHNITVTHVGVRVVGCEPPPPTPTGFSPYVPPPTLNPAQQTQQAQMTRTAQASITPFGTFTGNATAWAQTATAWANDGRATLDAISTQVYQGTPAATLLTPSPTPGAFGTPGPGGPGPGVPGIGGDIAGVANNVFGVIGNVGNIGMGWIGNLTSSVDRVITAWYAAPPQAPPGVPLCSSQPRSSEFCAILYIFRYTIFSGPVGSLIMPLATIVFDLFIVFTFIKFVRAIISRLGRVTV